MSYTAGWSVSAGDTPSASKWNQLGANDDALASGATWMTGAIVMWPVASAPTGWLICDGSSLLRAGTYAALFAIIGTTFGTADGTHFNIPDLRGKFPIGVSGSYALASSGGAATVNLAHTHTVASHTHTMFTTGVNNADWTTAAAVQFTKGVDNISGTNTGNRVLAVTDTTHPAASSTVVTGGATPATDSQLSASQSILPPYLAVNYIIKI